MRVRELGHVVLYVRDLERSRRFYRDLLGFPEIPVSLPGAAAFSAGRSHHELLLIEVGADAPGPPAGRRVGLYHIGLKIGDDDQTLRAALAELQAAGVPVVGAADHTVTHSLYVLDPDGHEVELFVDVPEVDWRADPTRFDAPVRPLRL